MTNAQHRNGACGACGLSHAPAHTKATTVDESARVYILGQLEMVRGLRDTLASRAKRLARDQNALEDVFRGRLRDDPLTIEQMGRLMQALLRAVQSVDDVRHRLVQVGLYPSDGPEDVAQRLVDMEVQQ